MKRCLLHALAAFGGACLLLLNFAVAQVTGDAQAWGNPASIINLATDEGVRLL